MSRNMTYVIVVFGILVVPLLLNYIVFSWQVPGLNGDLTSWMALIGNYSGGIIGGITALVVSRMQIKYYIDKDYETVMKTQCPVLLRVNTIIQNLKKNIEMIAIMYDSYKDPKKRANSPLPNISETDIDNMIVDIIRIPSFNLEKLDKLANQDIAILFIDVVEELEQLHNVLSFDLNPLIVKKKELEDKLSRVSNESKKSFIQQELRSNVSQIGINTMMRKELWTNIQNKHYIEKINTLIDLVKNELHNCT